MSETRTGYALVSYAPGNGQDIVKVGDPVVLPYATDEDRLTFDGLVARSVLSETRVVAPTAAKRTRKPRGR